MSDHESFGCVGWLFFADALAFISILVWIATKVG